MNDRYSLAGVVDALVRIGDAGWWPDLQNAIAEATRGPVHDLDRCPYLRMDVEELAQLTAKVIGLPIEVCRDAACERLLPTTRRRIVLEVLSEFDARLAEQLSATALTAKMARERARRQPV